MARDPFSEGDPEQKMWQRVNLWIGHDYFYDSDAVRVPYNQDSLSRYNSPMQGIEIQNHKHGRERGRENKLQTPHLGGANLRNVWTITTHSFQRGAFRHVPA